jgi:hypothetical protein
MELIEYQFRCSCTATGSRPIRGAGAWRGGCGLREVEALDHRMTTSSGARAGRTGPSVGGARSVREAKVARVEIVRRDGTVESIERNCVLTLEPGERFITRSAGGGPWARRSSARRRRSSRTSARASSPRAAREYGVARRGDAEVELEATARLAGSGLPDRHRHRRTFTDLRWSTGRARRAVQDAVDSRRPPAAIRTGIELISQHLGRPVPEFLAECEMIIHGTTVALNALIQLKGAKVGLLCTRGHEDSLEIRNGHKEDGHRYDFRYTAETMLVPRHMRVPDTGRVMNDGRPDAADEDDVRRGIEPFRREEPRRSASRSVVPPPRARAARGEPRRETLAGRDVTLPVDLLPQIMSTRDEHGRGERTPQLAYYVGAIEEMLAARLPEPAPVRAVERRPYPPSRLRPAR